MNFYEEYKIILYRRLEDPHTEREVCGIWGDCEKELNFEEMIEGKMLIEVCIRDKYFN